MGQAIWILILVVIWIITIAGTKSDGLLPPVFYIMPLVLTIPTVLWYSRHAIAAGAASRRLRKLELASAESDKKSAESEKKRHEAKQREIVALPPVQRMIERIKHKDRLSLFTFRFPKKNARQLSNTTSIRSYLKTGVCTTTMNSPMRRSAAKSVLRLLEATQKQRCWSAKSQNQAEEGALEMMRKTREQVRLIDYMAYPYTRYCKTPYEATQYAAQLKQSLPKIKELVDQHITHQSSETIQL